MIELTITLGSRTNPAIRGGGVSINTSGSAEAEALALIAPGAVGSACPSPIRSVAAPGFDTLIDCCLMQKAKPHRSASTRWLLPGLGVKAVVIGGGYATGRELAEFFLSRGPWGGLFAILFATLLFSIFCSLTFVAARRFETLRLQELLQAVARTCLAPLRARLSTRSSSSSSPSTELPPERSAMRCSPRPCGPERFFSRQQSPASSHSETRPSNDCFATSPTFSTASMRCSSSLALWKFGSACTGRLCCLSANLGLGGLRDHLLRLQYRRRGRDPAGTSPPDERPRRDYRRRHCRTADDASGAALLHSDGRFLSRGSERRPAIRLPSSAHRLARLPPPFPG